MGIIDKMQQSTEDVMVLYDRVLFWLLLGLICIGFVAISSGSISLGTRISDDPWYFMKREIFYYSITFMLSLLVLRIPMVLWRNYSFIILLFSYGMLLGLLIVNNSINGAARWIIWGQLCLQPSEFLKLSFICYLANYLDRKSKEVCFVFWGVCKPIIIMILLSLLLLLQPDFGSIIILVSTTLSILFLFGSKLWQLMLVCIFSVFLIVLSVFSQSYRIKRILAFWNPWQDPFGSGYQLTQSLMAFGRGGCFGRGLGNSIQKLEYLPEAHTDFIFSVVAEELGCFGAILVLLMLFMVVARAMMIGYRAMVINQKFSGILACSIGIWFSVQIFINIGTVSGIVPAKGLTLPFISYGGSSFLITVIAGMLLLRIDFENRLVKNHAILQKNYHNE